MNTETIILDVHGCVRFLVSLSLSLSMYIYIYIYTCGFQLTQLIKFLIRDLRFNFCFHQNLIGVLLKLSLKKKKKKKNFGYSFHVFKADEILKLTIYIFIFINQFSI